MRFRFEHKVPLARETVFAFFENPARLELLHAGWSKVRVMHGRGHVHVGAETWVELTIAGLIPMVLGFRHILLEPPVRFGEEAIHGPFSRFVHLHEFEVEGDKTVVRDLLDVRLPLHYGGEVIMKHVVARPLTRMFRHRAQALSRLANDGTIASCGFRNAASKER